MRHILMMIALLMISASAMAAKVEAPAEVMVMNFGNLNNSKISGLNLVDTEKALYDYAVESLTETGRFKVMEMSEETLKMRDINAAGVISLNDARSIGEALNIRYILYGQVMSITADETEVKVLDNGMAIHAVRARIMVGLMDTSTGSIIMAAKGEGESKSSLVKGGSEGLGVITIGTKRVTQDSVTQSLKKATRRAIEDLATYLYGDENGH